MLTNIVQMLSLLQVPWYCFLLQIWHYGRQQERSYKLSLLDHFKLYVKLVKWLMN